MILSKEQAQELIKYFNNQFIDRNSKMLYDGEILNELVRELNRYVNDTCGARHEDSYSVCGEVVGHTYFHYDKVTGKAWQK